MNHLIVGAHPTPIPTDPTFVFIDDEADIFNAHAFDVTRHSFNPLRGDQHFPRTFIAILDALYPRGENTLTKQNENYLIRNAVRLLMSHKGTTLDDVHKVLTKKSYRARLLRTTTDKHLKRSWEYIETWDEKDFRPAIQKMSDLLESETVRSVICRPTNFSFRGRVAAKLNRATLGDFDALTIGLCLIGHVQGHVVVPDFGFYGRDLHTSLIRQNRLTAAVNYLDEVPPKLRQALLTIKDKTVYRTTLDDAERLVPYLPKITKPSQLTDLADGECEVS